MPQVINIIEVINDRNNCIWTLSILCLGFTNSVFAYYRVIAPCCFVFTSTSFFFQKQQDFIMI